MSLGTTSRSDTRGPGLLRFHPLGTGRVMRYVALRSPELTLGRSLDCGFHVDDGEASRVHARLEGSKGYWQIIDNDSTNGLFVNGQRVTTRTLGGGELIRIGETFFRFFARGLSGGSWDYVIPTGPIVAGPAFQDIREVIDRAAGGGAPVLVHGEIGTGKELIASCIHQRSARRDGPFVPVDCGEVPRDIFESALFGREHGAATDLPGLLRQAAEGTLFLDEVGELPPGCQTRLLSFILDRQVQPVGSTRSCEADVRLVCATSRDLARFVRDATLLPDLYARLATVVIGLPPLRDRLEDIPLLVEHFLRSHGEGGAWSVTTRAMEHLCLQRWRSNVRELESAVRRAMLSAVSYGIVELEHVIGEGARHGVPDTRPMGPIRREQVAAPREELPAAAGGVPPDRPTVPTSEFPEDPRARKIMLALAHHDGDIGNAAAELGLSRKQLDILVRKLGIDVSLFRR